MAREADASGGLSGAVAHDAPHGRRRPDAVAPRHGRLRRWCSQHSIRSASPPWCHSRSWFHGDTDSWSGREWISQTGSERRSSPTLIPVVAVFITLVFIVKSVGAIGFRWWLLGRTTRISALSSAELARRYALAPYADHRSRRISEVYRNINDADHAVGERPARRGEPSSRTSSCSPLIIAVLAYTSLAVTLFAVVLFGNTGLRRADVAASSSVSRRRGARRGWAGKRGSFSCRGSTVSARLASLRVRTRSSTASKRRRMRAGGERGAADHGDPVRCSPIPA